MSNKYFSRNESDDPFCTLRCFLLQTAKVTIVVESFHAGTKGAPLFLKVDCYVISRTKCGLDVTFIGVRDGIGDVSVERAPARCLPNLMFASCGLRHAETTASL
jgi:hypothetical protein